MKQYEVISKELKIDDILRSPKDFSNYIEPSSIGGIKIVNKITKLN